MSVTASTRARPSRPPAVRVPRGDARYAVHLPATLVVAGGAREVRICEVSLSGIVVESEVILPIRRLIRCRLVLPTTLKVFEFHGMVVRRVGAEEGPPHRFGVMLYAVDRDARALWADVVRQAGAQARGEHADVRPPHPPHAAHGTDGPVRATLRPRPPVLPSVARRSA